MAPGKIEQVMQTAVQHHRAGRVREAEASYRQVLAATPDHAEALHLLGVIAGQTGRFEEAADLIRRAITAAPRNAGYHSDLGGFLQYQGKIDLAIDCYQRALAIAGDLPEVHYNMGVALATTGRIAEAVASFERAISLRPAFAEPYFQLGNAWMAARMPDNAIACYQQVVLLRPQFAQGHNALGTAYAAKRDFDQAIICYQRVLSLAPEYPDAHNNLGNALRNKGNLTESMACYQRALQLNPDYAEAHYNLAIAHKMQRNFDLAIASNQRALGLRPDYAEAHNNLGAVWKDAGHLDRAIASYQRAVALRPDYVEAIINLGNAYKLAARLDESVASLNRAVALDPDNGGAHDNLLNTLHCHPAYDAQDILAESLRWNARHGQPLKELILPHSNPRDPSRRLRIGYVSADLCEHAIVYLFLPLLREHNRSQVEVTCYAQVTLPDSRTQQMRQQACRWRDTEGLSDAQFADQVRDDQIDILVDMKLHTNGNRLLAFARKPAPIQVTWMVPGTTGLETMDYRLTDPYVDPPGLNDASYSERSIRLPATFWCYDPLSDEPAVNESPCARNGFVTFGNLNHYSKVNDAVLELWGKVLKLIDDSHLIVLASKGYQRQRVLERLGHAGIHPARIEFVGRQSRYEYLCAHHRIDVTLDPFPYNGHTTSLDSMWMGVPVVTLVGSTAVGRVGCSLLTNLRLPELIAATQEQYVQIATDLAVDHLRLAELRATLRQRMKNSPLMDAKRFARGIEDAYRLMWRRWCQC
jgi:predicted O-linked N-acetylglucosamine transferase (SPINDLY family)